MCRILVRVVAQISHFLSNGRAADEVSAKLACLMLSVCPSAEYTGKRTPSWVNQTWLTLKLRLKGSRDSRNKIFLHLLWQAAECRDPSQPRELAKHSQSLLAQPCRATGAAVPPDRFEIWEGGGGTGWPLPAAQHCCRCPGNCLCQWFISCKMSNRFEIRILRWFDTRGLGDREAPTNSRQKVATTTTWVVSEPRSRASAEASREAAQPPSPRRRAKPDPGRSQSSTAPLGLLWELPQPPAV